MALGPQRKRADHLLRDAAAHDRAVAARSFGMRSGVDMNGLDCQSHKDCRRSGWHRSFKSGCRPRLGLPALGRCRRIGRAETVAYSIEAVHV